MLDTCQRLDMHVQTLGVPSFSEEVARVQLLHRGCCAAVCSLFSVLTDGLLFGFSLKPKKVALKSPP